MDYSPPPPPLSELLELLDPLSELDELDELLLLYSVESVTPMITSSESVRLTALEGVDHAWARARAARRASCLICAFFMCA